MITTTPLRRLPATADETGEAKNQRLGCVLERHRHGECRDGGKALGVHLLDKRCHQGAGCAHKQGNETGQRRGKKNPDTAEGTSWQGGPPA